MGRQGLKGLLDIQQERDLRTKFVAEFRKREVREAEERVGEPGEARTGHEELHEKPGDTP